MDVLLEDLLVRGANLKDPAITLNDEGEEITLQEYDPACSIRLEDLYTTADSGEAKVRKHGQDAAGLWGLWVYGAHSGATATPHGVALVARGMEFALRNGEVESWSFWVDKEPADGPVFLHKKRHARCAWF